MAKRQLSDAQQRTLELGRRIGAAELAGDTDEAERLRQELRGGSKESAGSGQGRSRERSGDRGAGGSKDEPGRGQGKGRRGPRIVQGGYGGAPRSGQGDEPDDDEPDIDDDEGSSGEGFWYRLGRRLYG